jgi:hypothetical protein
VLISNSESVDWWWWLVCSLWLVPRPEILDACGGWSCFESLGRGVAAGMDVPCGLSLSCTKMHLKSGPTNGSQFSTPTNWTPNVPWPKLGTMWMLSWVRYSRLHKNICVWLTKIGPCLVVGQHFCVRGKTHKLSIRKQLAIYDSCPGNVHEEDIELLHQYLESVADANSIKFNWFEWEHRVCHLNRHKNR